MTALEIPPLSLEASDKVDAHLMRLRVEMFSAAQLLKGEQLETLKDIVRDMALVLRVSK